MPLMRIIALVERNVVSWRTQVSFRADRKVCELATIFLPPVSVDSVYAIINDLDVS